MIRAYDPVNATVWFSSSIFSNIVAPLAVRALLVVSEVAGGGGRGVTLNVARSGNAGRRPVVRRHQTEHKRFD